MKPESLHDQAEVLSPFQSWCINTQEARAFEYRCYLKTVIETAGSYDPKYNDIVERVLRSIPVPDMPMYPGEVTDSDKAWFGKSIKPDFTAILQEYLNKLK